MNTFESFGFSQPILNAIKEMGFETATPIQAQSFPILLGEDTDFLGLAQTGTGKTAAFGLPLLEKIDPKLRKTQGVILSPTRELSQQICQQMDSFTTYLGKIDLVPVFGGAPISTQIKQIKKGAHIIVGTPGRFIDLLRRKVIQLDDLNYIVLDEADEMLNMGFREDIDLILSHISGDKNTWLFSATMPAEIRRIIQSYMDDPQEVKINQEQKTNKNIQHMFSQVQGKHKHSALKRIIDVNPDMYGIVFCKTKRDTEEVSKKLSEDGYRADYLNGDLSQAQRDNVMRRFKNGQLNLLIATDVAARGIDVNNLTHVIHYSLPDQLENYTHRSGRTGRAGNKGISLSLISGKDKSRIKFMERKLDLKLEPYRIPLYSEVNSIRIKHWLESIVAIDETKLELDDATSEWLETSLNQIPKSLLIKKLLVQNTMQNGSGRHIEDLNDTGGMSKRDRGHTRDNRRSNDRDRGGNGQSWRRSKGNGTSMESFTIDIGSNMLSNKGHLLRLLCDESGLQKSAFGDINIRNKNSVISVDAEYAAIFKQNFKGTRVKGHKIKVSSGESSFSGRRNSRRNRSKRR